MPEPCRQLGSGMEHHQLPTVSPSASLSAASWHDPRLTLPLEKAGILWCWQEHRTRCMQAPAVCVDHELDSVKGTGIELGVASSQYKIGWLVCVRQQLPQMAKMVPVLPGRRPFLQLKSWVLRPCAFVSSAPDSSREKHCSSAR